MFVLKTKLDLGFIFMPVVNRGSGLGKNAS